MRKAQDRGKPAYEVDAASPFKRNPSTWSQRLPIAFLATIGFFISVYLGLYQWGLLPEVWDPVFGEGSSKVLTSDVSARMHTWFGIPRSDRGKPAYEVDAASPFKRNPSTWSQRLPIAFLATIGFFISVYLGLYQWGLLPEVWDPVFGEGSSKVLTSDVSARMHTWFGIP